MQDEVDEAEIAHAADRLGVAGRAVCVHASLRSFPRLERGPATLIDGLLSTGATVMVAAMAGESFAIPAPPDDRPARNGIDYPAKDRKAAAAPWPGLADTFDPTRVEVDSWLGATSAHVAARPDRVRSALSGEFCAVGPVANDLMSAEEVADGDVFGPLRALVERDGWVILVGVDLTSMTLLHVAEIEAGRKAFIRWMRAPDGSPTRIRVGGCSAGFERLAPALARVERRTVVGASTWRAYPAKSALRLAAKAIRSDPGITGCDDPSCQECPDAIAGGPIDP